VLTRPLFVYASYASMPPYMHYCCDALRRPHAILLLQLKRALRLHSGDEYQNHAFTFRNMCVLNQSTAQHTNTRKHDDVFVIVSTPFIAAAAAASSVRVCTLCTTLTALIHQSKCSNYTASKTPSIKLLLSMRSLSRDSVCS
jgi:hypothetical protein